MPLKPHLRVELDYWEFSCDDEDCNNVYNVMTNDVFKAIERFKDNNYGWTYNEFTRECFCPNHKEGTR